MTIEGTIKRIESEKDLGVFIDEKLNFREHITKKVNIVNRNLGIIFRAFTYMGTEMLLNLYKSMVRPHIEYATQVWSPQYKKDKITLENVQRRATRLVKCIKHLPYSEDLKVLGLPTLEYRRERVDMIQVYKNLHGIDKNSAKSFCVFLCCFVFFVFCVFYFIKISKFALPGVMLIYERTSKDRKKERKT